MPFFPRQTDARSRTAAPDRMQRLRVGLTGLASVALLIVVATAIASGVQRRVSVVRAPVAASAANASAATEPLAQLGAAPGAADDKANNPPAR